MSTAIWKDIAQALEELDEIYLAPLGDVDEERKLDTLTRIVGTLHNAVESSQLHATLLSLFQSSKGLGAMCLDYLKDRSVAYIIHKEDFYKEFVALLESIVLNESMRPLMMYILKAEDNKPVSCSTMLAGLADHLMLYKKVRWHVDPKLISREHTSSVENNQESTCDKSGNDVIEAILRTELALFGAASLQFSSARMYSHDQVNHSSDRENAQLPILHKLHAARRCKPIQNPS